jgi:hypothetical protein
VPKVFVEDFTNKPDEEFKKKVFRWFQLCILNLPRKVRERSNWIILLAPIYAIWIMYAISFYISPETLLKYFVFDINHPTITGMFFANFLHRQDSIQHIVSTSVIFFVSTILIIMFNMKRRSIFVATSLIFLLVLPFQLSAVDIFLLKYTGFTRTIGFSGVACAFFGYLAYVIITTMWSFTITFNYGKYEAVPWTYVNKFLICTILIVVIPIIYYILEATVLNVSTNAASHVTGYIYGLLVPQLVGIYIGTKRLNWKFAALSMLLLMLVILPIYVITIRIM